ncbi:hypothetical protein BJ322DRAFT_1070423 [Thelephora terrestris]|uniref:Uncharacterized protein n=1 Tax=Thelephora terrestris TaxID=56493 RepID=A0A9P6HB50_9AGAM|nr:hypothetical protein BJ322DRAFT_1070423 [Thelephora terrestris]
MASSRSELDASESDSAHDITVPPSLVYVVHPISCLCRPLWKQNGETTTKRPLALVSLSEVCFAAKSLETLQPASLHRFYLRKKVRSFSHHAAAECLSATTPCHNSYLKSSPRWLLIPAARVCLYFRSILLYCSQPWSHVGLGDEEQALEFVERLKPVLVFICLVGDGTPSVVDREALSATTDLSIAPRGKRSSLLGESGARRSSVVTKSSHRQISIPTDAKFSILLGSWPSVTLASPD